MRPIPPVALVQHGVFTGAQAAAAGWTPSALRHAVSTGRVLRLRPGVFAVLPVVGDEHQLAALRRAAVAIGLTHRRMTVSHRSAAVLHGLPILRRTATPCVTFARPFRGRVRGAHLHRAFLWPGDVARLGNQVLLTSAARTVVDLGRELGADQCVVTADAALRSGLATRGQLDLVAQRCAGWAGMRAATHALADADPRAESALESISRLRLREAGLPAPQLQPVIRVGGRFVGRVDFYWDECGVVAEADGLAKYAGSALSLRDEKRRQSELERAGLIVVRWAWSDLATFDVVTAELRAAFARGLRTDRLPRRWQATCHSVRDAG